MSLLYGVIPRCHPLPEDNNKFTQIVDNFIINRKWAQVGDKIVLLTGQPIGTAGGTNAVIVHTVGDKK
jgi:pyruvate kinase